MKLELSVYVIGLEGKPMSNVKKDDVTANKYIHLYVPQGTALTSCVFFSFHKDLFHECLLFPHGLFSLSPTTKLRNLPVSTANGLTMD